jgi:hypothetical protein
MKHLLILLIACYMLSFTGCAREEAAVPEELEKAPDAEPQHTTTREGHTTAVGGAETTAESQLEREETTEENGEASAMEVTSDRSGNTRAGTQEVVLCDLTYSYKLGDCPGPDPGDPGPPTDYWLCYKDEFDLSAEECGGAEEWVPSKEYKYWVCISLYGGCKLVRWYPDASPAQVEAFRRDVAEAEKEAQAEYDRDNVPYFDVGGGKWAIVYPTSGWRVVFDLDQDGPRLSGTTEAFPPGGGATVKGELTEDYFTLVENRFQGEIVWEDGYAYEIVGRFDAEGHLSGTGTQMDGGAVPSSSWHSEKTFERLPAAP